MPLPWSQALGAALTRGPYLQSNTTQSAIVVWELDSSASAVLEYGFDLSGDVSGSSFEDPAQPTDGQAFYYLFALGGDCAVASWQTERGAEPSRDVNLP